MAQRNGNSDETYCEEEEMIPFIQSKKYILTIVLALIAMGIEFYYSICAGSCSYLKGDIFGIGLQYIGIAFMVCRHSAKYYQERPVAAYAAFCRELEWRYTLWDFRSGTIPIVFTVLFLEVFLWYSFSLILIGRRKRQFLLSMAVALLIFPICFSWFRYSGIRGRRCVAAHIRPGAYQGSALR